MYADYFQFGRFEDVANDCCGFCPVPETEDEKAIAEEEAKVFVSSKISFMKDDPGRQVMLCTIFQLPTTSMIIANTQASQSAHSTP